MENRHLVCNLSINGQLFIAVSVYQRLKQINQPFYGDALRIEMFFWGCKKSGWWCIQCRVCLKTRIHGQAPFLGQCWKTLGWNGVPYLRQNHLYLNPITSKSMLYGTARYFASIPWRQKQSDSSANISFQMLRFPFPVPTCACLVCLSDGSPPIPTVLHIDLLNTPGCMISNAYVYIYIILNYLYLFEISYTMSYWHLSTTYEVSNYQSTFS